MKPAPEMISQRLKGQFAPAYLTLTSIIQGVALSVLAARVEATYAQFDATDWLLTIATFLVFLEVWNEYLMQVLAFVWLPTLLGSLSSRANSSWPTSCTMAYAAGSSRSVSSSLWVGQQTF